MPRLLRIPQTPQGWREKFRKDFQRGGYRLLNKLEICFCIGYSESWFDKTRLRKGCLPFRVVKNPDGYPKGYYAELEWIEEYMRQQQTPIEPGEQLRISRQKRKPTPTLRVAGDGGTHPFRRGSFGGGRS